jgi:hypothetical protein
MATSGSTNYSRNALQIITGALRKLRIITAGSNASGADLTTGLEALNLMVKAWQIDEVFMWFYQEAILHLELDGQSYTLGPTGGHFCSSSAAVKTTLSASAAAAATALTVASNDGVTTGSYIGVELDSGVLYWSTQSGAPVGTTDLTLAAGITTEASSGNNVFAYTTKLARPVDITEARLRDINDNDTPINIVRSNDQYFQRNNDKTSTGDVSDILLVPHITNATLYTYPVCEDVTKRIFMTIQRVVEDFDSSTDDPDFPAEVIEGLVYNLAVRLSPEYRQEVPKDVAVLAAYTYEQIKGKFKAREPQQLQPPSYMRITPTRRRRSY